MQRRDLDDAVVDDVNLLGLEAEAHQVVSGARGDGDDRGVLVDARHQTAFEPVPEPPKGRVRLTPEDLAVNVVDEQHLRDPREQRREEWDAVLAVDDDVVPAAELEEIRDGHTWVERETAAHP